MSMLLLALQWGGIDYAWNSFRHHWLIRWVRCHGGSLLIPWQLYLQDNALIPPSLFKTHRNVWLLCAASFFVNGPFQAIIYWLPIWFQTVLEVSPLQSGINYFPYRDSRRSSPSFHRIGPRDESWMVEPLPLLFAGGDGLSGEAWLSTLHPTVSSGHSDRLSNLRRDRLFVSHKPGAFIFL